jgi:hypothetical protein
VGGDAFLFEELVDVEAELFIEAALVGEGAFLLAIEGGGVVLELHDEFAGVLRGEQFLRLAFVDQVHRLGRGNSLVEALH